ncbi:conserved hypothetical protein [delta proteobacterium NaphS2]|nr:conserved hypothetical protein [delta proteobacterium NaphS2]
MAFKNFLSFWFDRKTRLNSNRKERVNFEHPLLTCTPAKHYFC